MLRAPMIAFFMLANLVFVATAEGTIPRTQQVPSSTPTILDPAGNPIMNPRVAQNLIIESLVTNNDTVSHTFTFLLQLQDSNGVPVFLAWLRGATLEPGGTMSLGLGWIPDLPGVFEGCVFVWESLEAPIALSPVQCITFTISP